MSADKFVTFTVNSTTPNPDFLKFPGGFMDMRKCTGVTSIKEAWFKGSSILKDLTKNEKDVVSAESYIMHTPIFGHGFLEAAHHAYNNHLPLVISPDDLWITIIFGLNHYMKYRSEDLRSAFVDFDGKKQLIVETLEDMIEGGSWEDVLNMFEVKLSAAIKQDWLVPNFTTTTPYLRTIAQIGMLGVVSDFFSCGIQTMCGIPSVTMKGTLEDWNLLKNLIIKLGELGGDLNNWSRILLPIIDKLIESYSGTVDVHWWNRIIHQIGESGHQTITGWITAFFPFKIGVWQLNSVDNILCNQNYGNVLVRDINTYGSVHVPVKYNCVGKLYDLALYAECKDCEFDTETSQIQPHFGMCIVRLPDGTIKDSYDWKDTSVKHV